LGTLALSTGTQAPPGLYATAVAYLVGLALTLLVLILG
jgi:hypothetical protein